jgi:PPOX class probable F420-dependent enzyme
VRLAPGECRRRFAGAPSARLATVTPDGDPHIVPIVFALLDPDPASTGIEGAVIVTVVDAKPKSTTRLQRLANLEREPRASVLADHYDDDWDRLWWVRADGTATISSDPADLAAAVAAIARRHPQYLTAPPPGPAITITVHRWTGWAAGSA